jgi:hypothetical protein
MIERARQSDGDLRTSLAVLLGFNIFIDVLKKL